MMREGVNEATRTNIITNHKSHPDTDDHAMTGFQIVRKEKTGKPMYSQI